MTEQFIPYKQALELVKLGMKFYAFGYYNKSILDGLWKTDVRIWDSCEDYMDAILWQQAFDWFEENHGLSGCVFKYPTEYDNISPYRWRIHVLDTESRIKAYSGFSKTKLEAKLACLDKLIELVKSKRYHNGTDKI